MEELTPKKRGRKPKGIIVGSPTIGEEINFPVLEYDAPETSDTEQAFLIVHDLKEDKLYKNPGEELVKPNPTLDESPKYTHAISGVIKNPLDDSAPVLSVCIPVIAEHLPTLEKIGRTLGVEIEACVVGINTFYNPVDNIEVLVMLTDRFDKGGPSRGLKRNELLKASKGLYVVSVDADDVISDQYVQSMLTAIKQGPDCIGFKIDCMINGKYFPAIASLRFADWTRGTTLGKSGAIERMPYHKTPIKREIALQVGFEARVDFGEDYIYSKGVKKLLKTEVFIDEVLYHYIK